MSVCVCVGACECVFCLARARWQRMFSQMGLEIRIKWTSNYLDAQSLDDTLLQQRREVERLSKFNNTDSVSYH